EKQHRQPLERFSWPLGAALLLLAIEFMISGRKSAQALQTSLIKTAGRRIRQGINNKTLLLFLLISLAGLNRGHASQGEKDFAGGNYLGAAEWYDQALKKNPDDPRLHYNAGTAAYKNNLYDQAISSFQQALKSDDLGLQEQTYYNLGNALTQRGEELAQSDPGQTEKLWRQAKDAYTGSLSLNQEAKDSKENRELVSRKLEELKKQQEQQRQQQDKNKQQKEEQKQEQKKSGDQQKEQGDKGQPGQPEKQDNGDRKQGKDDESPQPDKSSEPGKNLDDPTDKAKDPSADQPTGDEPQAQQPDSGQGAKSSNDDQPQKDSASTQAARPTQAGKMTEDEARQLLSRLKEEEGKLNFVPQTGQGKAEKEGTWKDW
ncbi:MAG: tetratricopeptide repeat protein, partial [Chlorobium sp.]|nr:tetratricopeptide repeat protein [Chlorobium sp.]